MAHVLQDRQRIKQQGAGIQDVMLRKVVESEDKDGNTFRREFNFVPPSVLGDVTYAPEPDWHTLPQMSYMEFYHGLRQRNWTSPYYDSSAEPWNIQIFHDSGRFLLPAFDGFRAYITKQDGSRYVQSGYVCTNPVQLYLWCGVVV